MKIHEVQADEIYIVLFIKYKKKNPGFKYMNHGVHREARIFPEEFIFSILKK
jgi:hypothetical protein